MNPYNLACCVEVFEWSSDAKEVALLACAAACASMVLA
jgi:hypothetical protein